MAACVLTIIMINVGLVQVCTNEIPEKTSETILIVAHALTTNYSLDRLLILLLLTRVMSKQLKDLRKPRRLSGFNLWHRKFLKSEGMLLIDDMLAFPLCVHVHKGHVL